MSIETMLVILLVILLIGALPSWPYSRSWGYTPTGVLGLVLAIFIIWILVGNKESRSVGDDLRMSAEDVGQDIKRGAQEAGEDIKELGRDVKESVKDAVN